MAFFRDVSDRFWNYVSPRKTQQRREKPFKVPAPPTHAKVAVKRQKLVLERREMSPQSLIKVWQTRTVTPTSDGDVDETLLPPSPPSSASPVHDDFEGDTLLPDTPVSPSYLKGQSENEFDANGEVEVVDDGTYLMQPKRVDVDAERQRRDIQGRELRDAGWSEDAIFLFQKLGMRGFEPLLPIDWHDDFETLPEDLFTPKLDLTYIRPALGSDYHAKLALSSLFDVGSLARDAWRTRAPKRTPAYQIKRAIQNYTKWATKDGDVDQLWAALPLFEQIAFPLSVHTSIVEAKMIKKLGVLHGQWHEALQLQARKLRTTAPEVPTLYGVTASHTVMAFVSYSPPTEQQPQASLRLIAMFDFGKEGFDVWNSLAVAIFAIHCRNRMMQLKDSLPEPYFSTDEDPDL